VREVDELAGGSIKRGYDFSADFLQ
jgi:hypothetical protein